MAMPRALARPAERILHGNGRTDRSAVLHDADGVEDVRRKLTEEDLFVIRRAGSRGLPFRRAAGDTYYLGKIAVREDLRGRGLPGA
jgi:hypothetical protein